FQYHVAFSSHLPAPTDLHPLSLHDALPILNGQHYLLQVLAAIYSKQPFQPWLPYRLVEQPSYLIDSAVNSIEVRNSKFQVNSIRSEEHTSELQSRFDLVCRLLLEKKK